VCRRRRQLDGIKPTVIELWQKKEVLWCVTSRRQHQLPSSVLSVDGTPVKPVKSARDPGIYIDDNLLMRTHVQRTVSQCFAALRQLRQIRHLVPTETFQTPVVSLVLASLDYGNSVLAGLPTYLVRRLQSAMNAAARLIYHLRRSDHISDALACLHWLRVPERIYTVSQKKLHRFVFVTTSSNFHQFG